MTSKIVIRFDGSLCIDEHKVSLRTLSRALQGVQGAVDRAYIDQRFGNVHKHARLPYDAYDDTEFVVGDPVEGSFVIDFTSALGREVVRRIIDALQDPYRKAREEAVADVVNVAEQIANRKFQIEHEIVEVRDINELNLQNDPLAMRTYGDKSISKEIDQVLTMVRRDPDARFDITLQPQVGDIPQTFEFDQRTAKRFSAVLKQRQLGSPVICTGTVRELDHGQNQRANFKGKFINAASGKTVVIHIDNEERFSMLRPHIGGGEIRILACPIVEYESFDPVAGDIQFIEVV